MENSKKHLEDITEIRQIMEKSTRFLSLSGWAGIFAGLFALLGALAAYIFLGGGDLYYDKDLDIVQQAQSLSPRLFLLIDAAIVLSLALFSALFFSARKAKKNGEKLWTPVMKRLLFHLFIPLAAGGIFSLILIWKELGILVAPLTLIFYGIALLNAGKYTNKEIVWLALAEIISGLAAAIWIEASLYFWAAGFGLYHILYGAILYFKYDRKVA